MAILNITQRLRMEGHVFYDKDVDKILAMENSVELCFKGVVEAVVLREPDVKALAIYFGLIKD